MQQDKQALARVDSDKPSLLTRMERSFFKFDKYFNERALPIMAGLSVSGYVIGTLGFVLAEGGFTKSVFLSGLFPTIFFIMLAPLSAVCLHFRAVAIASRMREKVLPELLDEMEGSRRADFARMALVIRLKIHELPKNPEDFVDWMEHLRSRVREGQALPSNFFARIQAFHGWKFKHLTANENTFGLVKKYETVLNSKKIDGEYRDEEEILPVVLSLRALDAMLGENPHIHSDLRYPAAIKAVDSLLNGLIESIPQRAPLPKHWNEIQIALADNNDDVQVKVR